MVEALGPLARGRGARLMAGVLVTAISLPVLGSSLVLPVPSSPGGTPLLRSNPIKLIRPGERVVCLYDSGEGTARDRNPLSAIVAPAIEGMGFQVVWHDVAEGLPQVNSMSGVRAVVSGFLDAAMDDAAAYASFVRTVIAGGKRFVVVGNYGAYQERSTGAYLDGRDLNPAFEALGVRYEADWTNDPNLFDVTIKADDMATGRSLDSSAVRHFYRITPVRDDVRVLVEAVRKDGDRPGRPSAVVFTSSTGALALTRYLSASDMIDDPEALWLDVRSFLQAGLAIDPPDASTLLVLFDRDSEDSKRAMTALAAASSYTNIPLAGVSSNDFRNLRPADLSSFAGIVLACPEVPSAVSGFLAGLLRNHVRDGGRLLAVLPIRDPSIASVIWGRPVEPSPGEARGIRFNEGAFPGISGIRVAKASTGFSGLQARPGTKCTVLAESLSRKSGRHVPLWWRCPVGKGTITALNAFEFADRAFLGFMVQSILNAEGSWAMPVLAATVEFVDDCPLPMTGRFLEPMGKKDTDFYAGDFFGMVLKAADGVGIKPAFLSVFSYDDRVSPPFEELYPGPVGDVSRELARRIVEHDFVAGLHGLNHLSPAVGGGVSKTFPDGHAMALGFDRAREEFYEVFGHENRPTVYVPPNDYMDIEGKKALVKSIPEVRIVASVLSGSDVEMQQDFSRDPDVPWLTAFPRTWAGYLLEGDPVLGMLNGVLLMSVNSHFIHPDDVLDPERSRGRSWKELEDGYIAGLKQVRTRFPFLREMSILEAAEELDRLLSLGWKVTVRPDGSLNVVRSAGSTSPVTLLVRLREGCVPKVSAGGSVLFSDPVSGRHHVRMDGRVLQVGCDSRSAESDGRVLARGPLAPRGAR